jgi:hypothetical protein
LKVGDVDAVLAADRAKQADDAGRVGIGRIEHVLADLGVEIDALDLDEARLAVGVDGVAVNDAADLLRLEEGGEVRPAAARYLDSGEPSR